MDSISWVTVVPSMDSVRILVRDASSSSTCEEQKGKLPLLV